MGIGKWIKNAILFYAANKDDVDAAAKKAIKIVKPKKPKRSTSAPQSGPGLPPET
jgi:hypothetical protein